LSGWVRDRQLMPVERGIRKLTGELGDLLGIGRGYVREGAPADVVVIDWEHLGPGPIRRVRDMPANGERLIADAPTGIDAIIVNGVPITEAGKAIPGVLPGTTLRSATT
jgi:N-acyl-D-amino-acid deacylase